LKAAGGVYQVDLIALMTGLTFDLESQGFGDLAGLGCQNQVRSAVFHMQLSRIIVPGETSSRLLVSGNEAVALAALHAGVALGTGYPGTPSTEILEHFGRLGGKAQWSPNEKVALEVGIGAAFAQTRTLVTMKHVGVNVAADPLFIAAYSGVDGGLVVVSADDPGMFSSQNEQDNRRYALHAGVPMFEPADSQEAYDLTRTAFELSEQFQLPVMLRLTTRVCHSKGIVVPAAPRDFRADTPHRCPQFRRAIPERVMIPAHARPAHRRLRKKLADVKQWNEVFPGNIASGGEGDFGIITSGVSYLHVREAAPSAPVLKLSCTYPLPIERIRAFVSRCSRCLVVEEGDPFLYEAFRAEGIGVEGKTEQYRFGELNVQRVRAIIAGEPAAEPAPAKGKPPELCQGCPHRKTFDVLRDINCIVSGDIGCYTLGALEPFSAMDIQLCMGASIGVGAGLRHVLPEAEARRVVSVIGDSTFLHSGLTGLAEIIYNRPDTGHVLLILDNSTTAMTGLQDHAGTGRTLAGKKAKKIVLEQVAAAMGADSVDVVDPVSQPEKLRALLLAAMSKNEISVIIVRRACLLALRKESRRAREQNKCIEQTQQR